MSHMSLAAAWPAAASVAYIARISPMLGHSMGTLCLYELPHEVQKLLGGSGGILPKI